MQEGGLRGASAAGMCPSPSQYLAKVSAVGNAVHPSAADKRMVTSLSIGRGASANADK